MDEEFYKKIPKIWVFNFLIEFFQNSHNHRYKSSNYHDFCQFS